MTIKKQYDNQVKYETLYDNGEWIIFDDEVIKYIAKNQLDFRLLEYEDYTLRCVIITDTFEEGEMIYLNFIGPLRFANRCTEQ